MSEDNGDPFSDAAQRFTDSQNQFARMWTDFAGKMASAGVSFSPETTPPDTARQMRATFFKALSDYCQDYMRSPEFLDSWKQTMDGAIQFRRQMNESLGKMQHEFGGTSRQDVDSTMAAIAHLERRLVDTIERASERIDDMAGRIEALEQAVGDDAPDRARGESPAGGESPKSKKKGQGAKADASRKKKKDSQ